ncbi:MAG: hypothetical protein AAF721_27030 [Myxococcota bacterium]
MVLAVVAGLICALWAAPGEVRPAPVAGGGGEDRVDIVAPEDAEYFADVPAAVTVVVEVTNDSALEVQEVHLEVDAEDQTMTCDGPGTCEWSLQLPEGVHELRSFVVRNIGGPLFSQFVNVQVGGEPPEGADDDGDTGGDPMPGTDGGDESTGGAGDGTGDGAGGEEAEASGCGCRSGAATGGLPFLVVLLAARRRRR